MSSWTRIDHLGHTTFRVALPDANVLIDPVLIQPGLRFENHRIPEWWFPAGAALDALFISHGHTDHLHPPTLLGLPRELPVFAYGEEAIQELKRLGFQNLTSLKDGLTVSIGDHLKIHPVPAAPSSEGTPQCCFLVETPDAIVLDLVDAADSEITRSALESWRGKIDLAFVPSGASFQWRGYWNQMDPVAAANFTAWLEAAAVAPCGGAISAHGSRAPGSLQRYPHGRADWYAAATAAHGTDVLLKWQTPFFISYRNHEVARAGPLPQIDVGSQARLFEKQALITTFFSGFDLRSPVRPLGKESLKTLIESWQPAREAIRESAAQLSELLARCELSAHATPASRLARRTIRHLCRAGELDLAGRIASLVPNSANPADLALGFFDIVEAWIRRGADLSDVLRDELLRCLAIDRAFAALEREANEMKGRGSSPAEADEKLISQHLSELRRSAHRRRPVLSPNQLRVLQSELPLLLDQPIPHDITGCLAVATPDGVRVIMLRRQEEELLNQCDGRTFTEIANSLAQELEIDRAIAETGLLELLMGLTRASVHLIDWSA